MKEQCMIRLDNPRAWRTYVGGSLLDALHGNPNGEDGHFPEEWIMSLVAARNAGRETKDEGMSHLYGQELTLKELIEQNPSKYLGKDHAEKNGVSLGVLVKLIDSGERLTLQVHPDRRTAMELFHSPYGKTECWHILGGRKIGGDAPCIYLGFKQGITRELWKILFERQDIEGMLAAMERYDVKEGDTILIEGGMPHAIGAGCFLVEIQEPTDYTIRVERTTPNGFQMDDFLCHQGLGFDKMFDVFHYDSLDRETIREKYFIRPIQIEKNGEGEIRTLVGYENTPMFRLDEICTSGRITIPSSKQFSGFYVLEGCGKAKTSGGEVALEKTAQFFNPAGIDNIIVEADPGYELRILHFFGPQE